MAELTRPPITSNSNGVKPKNDYAAVTKSNFEAGGIRSGPIHIVRNLSQHPDPNEPIHTPPNDDAGYFIEQRFGDLNPPEFKSGKVASGGSKSRSGINTGPTLDTLNNDEELAAARKKLVEKEKDLSIKEARKWKRVSQEYPDDFHLANAEDNALMQSTLASVPPLPLTALTRDISTASTNTPAARPFDDGTYTRRVMLEELMAFEFALEDQMETFLAESSPSVRDADSNNTSASASTGRNNPSQKQVAALLDSTSKKGLYHNKKKLILENLNLTAKDIPVRAICQKPLGKELDKLSLAGNKLSIIPDRLVLDLHGLQTLDLQQCDLTTLPTKWNLISLRRLVLSHNKLQDFLEEDALKGLPQLRHLDLYDNKLCELILPASSDSVLTKLEFLNLGFNDLTYLPEELTQLKNLRVLKAPNNLITHVSKSIVHMDLRELEVAPNPLVQPPLEDCERGIYAMRRYYRCLGDNVLSSGEIAKPLLGSARHAMGASGSQSTPGHFMRRLHDKGKKVRALLETSPMKNKAKQMVPFVFYNKKPQTTTLTNPPLVQSSQRNTQATAKIPDEPTVEKHQTEHSRSLSSADSTNVSIDLPIGTVERQGAKDSSVSLLSHLSSFDSTKGVKQMHSIDNDVVDETNLISRPVISSVLTPASKASVNDEAKYDDYLLSLEEELQDNSTDEVALNDTLKIIFLGMAYTGKTSLIRRLKDGGKAFIPKKDERTIGVDIYEWDPRESDTHINECRETLNTRVNREDGTPTVTDIKFSVWDFAGQAVYHATHELFFSPRALYVLVWDMGANNSATRRRGSSYHEDYEGPFALIDSDDEDTAVSEPEARRADRALERDIDEKVQFWVDCIQSSVPGSVILPVATFDDYFDTEGGAEEARRRCNVMKRRLLQHEERRKAGIEVRLQYLYKTNRANSEAAKRLKTLLCSMARPKLIFGDGNEIDSVIRVSSTSYRGFCKLRSKIVNIACGRDLGGHNYLFGGHVGVPIPRLRLEVRNVVRQKRNSLKVVEWQYFVSILRQALEVNGEELRDDDISDALQFLTTIGELSYFGRVVETPANASFYPHFEYQSDDEDEINDNILAIDDISNDLYSEYEESYSDIIASLSSKTNVGVSGLSDYVFLNPRWLVEVVACILRHDLRQEIDETKRLLQESEDYQVYGDWKNAGRASFLNANINCPIISAEEACMLWKTKKIIYKAAERAKNESSGSTTMTTFEFLQRLLVRFSVLVPIDLSVEKAEFGGKEYGMAVHANAQEGEMRHTPTALPEKPYYFFLPSLLGPSKPPDQIWTFKCSEAWKRTLCVSWCFPDGCPPGLMERVTASVLRDVYAATRHDTYQQDHHLDPGHIHHRIKGSTGKLRVIEVLCWRTTFLITFGMQVLSNSNGETRESVVEIFTHIADQNDPFCVAANSMGIGTRRLVVSAKGQHGDGGRKIWQGGFEMVTKAVERVVREYGGLEFEKEGVCPDCLADIKVTDAGVWNWTQVIQASRIGGAMPRCKEGHSIDYRLVGGFLNKSLIRADSPGRIRHLSSVERNSSSESAKPVDVLSGAVVLVGLFDFKLQKILRVGSGFIVDNKRGLVVTAAHTLCRWEGPNFGEIYDGLKNAKAIIGVIPKEAASSGTAVFRYLAEIVETDVLHMDACVLKIKTKLERDCIDYFSVPEIFLHDLKAEGLQQLKVIATKPAREERVRIIGFNQGGEGLWRPGEILNREVDFSAGHIVRFFQPPEGIKRGKVCIPRFEIIVDCSTIGGHSGGPCVNQNGEVVGILSRADPADLRRCYLVPASEFMVLVEKSKKPRDDFGLFS